MIYFIWIALLLFSGCGTDDYGEDPIHPEAAAPLKGWRENALASRTKAAELSKGENAESKGALQSLPLNPDCPLNALCLRSPYFGEEQLALLATAKPDVFHLDGPSGERRYKIRNVDHLLIETDLFLLQEGATLRFCGENLSIIASEVSGGGKIDTSGGCGPSTHAGNISIISSIAKEIHLVANGVDGRNGKDGVATWSPAANGNPKAVSIDVSLKPEPFRICADALGCMREVIKYFKTGKSGWDGLLEVMEEADKVARKNLNYLNRIGFPTSDFERYALEAAEKEKDLFDAMTVVYGGGGCFLISDPAVGSRHTGVVKSFRPVAKGFEGLHGEDAKFRADGENGEDGGSSGDVEVYARELKLSHIETRAGKAGRAGKSFVQEPGVGVSPAETSKDVSYKFYGYFSCEFIPDDKGQVKTYYVQWLDYEIKKTFKLGEKYACNAEEKYGEHLGEGFLDDRNQVHGKSGKALAPKETRDGIEGKEKEPSLIQAPVDDLIQGKLEELCPKCSMPKAFQEGTP